MTNKLQEKHLQPTTGWRSEGYIDREQVNQKESYYIKSRPRNAGGCYVYQYITMNDGTIYELSSMTASTRGIVANNCRASNVLQREIKSLTNKDGVIRY